MERRKFLGSTAVLGAVASTALPAHAQGTPAVKWRMSTNWPKSLDTMYGSAEQLCKRVPLKQPRGRLAHPAVASPKQELERLRLGVG